MDINKAFFTVREFAQELRVHPNTVRKCIRNGHIQGFKVGSSIRSGYRIPASEIDRMALFSLREYLKNVGEG